MTGTHPDDDALSAHLDGMEPELSTHVERCPACRARLEALGAVAHAVATPPAAPAPVTIDVAVSAALASLDDPARSKARDEAPARVPVVGIRSAPANRGGGTRRAGRRRTLVPPPAWLAVAAAAVAVLVAVPVLMGDDRGRDQVATSQAGGGAEDRATLMAPAQEVLPVVGPDLGEQSDMAAVASLVSHAVPAPLAAGATVDAQPRVAAARPAPEAASGPAPTSPSAPGRCFGEAVSAGRGALGPVVYVATLRWRGVPAVVLVFLTAEGAGGGGGGTGGRHAYVMNGETCALLAEQRF